MFVVHETLLVIYLFFKHNAFTPIKFLPLSYGSGFSLKEDISMHLLL